ncbi:unnamed protein product [Heterobilharzia americana]|nr:unnamed protein product [Heterobilharzia americana]
MYNAHNSFPNHNQRYSDRRSAQNLMNPYQNFRMLFKRYIPSQRMVLSAYLLKQGTPNLDASTSDSEFRKLLRKLTKKPIHSVLLKLRNISKKFRWHRHNCISCLSCYEMSNNNFIKLNYSLRLHIVIPQILLTSAIFLGVSFPNF